MSTLPLILKDGVLTFSRGSTDIAAINAYLGITAALALKANSASPNLTGTPTSPTATAGTNTNQIATTAFVTNAVSVISTSSFVDLTNNQSINGVKTFTGALQLPTTAGTTSGTLWRNGDALEYKDGSNITKILLNSAGNLSNLVNKQTSLNNLVGTQTANRVLRSDGTNVTLSQVSLTTDVINTLPIASGGTGSSTQNFVDLTTVQTIAGAKTLTSSLTIRGDVGIMNLFGNNDAYNTFRFTGNINTSSSYWDIGVGPSGLNRDFYISSGYAGGGLGFRINATNYNFTLSGAMIVSNTTASTSTTTGSITSAGGLGVVGNAYVGGFTSLGDNVAVKVKYLTGTSGSTDGSAINIAHGLTFAKIISVNTLLEYTTGNCISTNYTNAVGYQYDVNVGGTNIAIQLKAGNSAQILNKPVRVTITYSS